MQMKNGKYIKIAVLSFFIGSYFGNKSFKKNIKQKDLASWSQYINRLSEFCIYDLEGAKQEFISLIESGIEYEEAFNLTLLSKANREITFGELND
jgi:hypothetical protein